MATFWIEDNMLRAEGLTPGSLEESLTKWEILFAASVAGDLVYDGSCNTCSLCHQYIFRGDDCVGCPIWARTGLFDCRDTPYEHYYHAVKRGDHAMAISAAEEMVLFLEELLEESDAD